MLISPPDSWLRGVPVSPATSRPDIETALSLLEEHASKIQPIQVVMLCLHKILLSSILPDYGNFYSYNLIFSGIRGITRHCPSQSNPSFP